MSKKRYNNYGITYIAGGIGVGKSCLATKIALQYLKKNWQVYSNHFICGCYQIKISDLFDGYCPENSIIIIDESGLEINSRDFKNLNRGLLEYCKLCRHYKNKLFILSQVFDDTDKQIRNLASAVLFIRPVIPHVLSMPVKVSGSLQINKDGQPAVEYKIGKVAMPYYLPKYFKYYNSFDIDNDRKLIDNCKWCDLPNVRLIDSIKIKIKNCKFAKFIRNLQKKRGYKNGN